LPWRGRDQTDHRGDLEDTGPVSTQTPAGSCCEPPAELAIETISLPVLHGDVTASMGPDRRTRRHPATHVGDGALAADEDLQVDAVLADVP
jgi:hypothetical protein